MFQARMRLEDSASCCDESDDWGLAPARTSELKTSLALADVLVMLDNQSWAQGPTSHAAATP